METQLIAGQAGLTILETLLRYLGQMRLTGWGL